MLFVQEIINSDIPIDLDEFIYTYHRSVRRGFYRR